LQQFTLHAGDGRPHALRRQAETRAGEFPRHSQARCL
jgi:hypothetical protein